MAQSVLDSILDEGSSIVKEVRKAMKQESLSSYDIKLLRTFPEDSQIEFLDKIIYSKWTFLDCLKWYNSY